MEKYRDAKWKLSFDNLFFLKRAQYRSLQKNSILLSRLQKDNSDKMTLDIVGKSVGDNDILLVTITDKSISDENKQIVFFLGAEHGMEVEATKYLIDAIEWLLTPEAEEIRRLQKILIIPCVNPDGYETLHMDNMNGINLFTDYFLDGKPTQPESLSVWKVIEKYQPEVVSSCHGGGFADGLYSSFSNIGGSYWSSRYERSHSRLFVEEINKACEKAGKPVDRMEEDAERILIPLPNRKNTFNINEADDTPGVTGEAITPDVYAYNRFHSLMLTMECPNLIKIKKILELGNKSWRYEPLPGYPVRVMSNLEPFGIVAYGITASERRKSRVELWQSNNTITKYSIPLYQEKGFAGIGFSILPEDRSISSTSSEISKLTKAKDILDYFSSDKNMDIETIRKVLAHRLNAPCYSYFDGACENPVWLKEVKNGISLRLRLPPHSKIKRVLINGRLASESNIEGYETWTLKNSFTIVQINIPSGKSIASLDGFLRRAICTIEYK